MTKLNVTLGNNNSAPYTIAMHFAMHNQIPLTDNNLSTELTQLNKKYFYNIYFNFQDITQYNMSK